jgi:hypothetical protein
MALFAAPFRSEPAPRGVAQVLNPEAVLIVLLAATLALLMGGIALPRLVAASPALWAHLVLAVGVMSLITAAMQHFAPVLARGRIAGVWLARLPWLMAATGLLVVSALAGWLPWSVVALAALLGLGGALAMVSWMIGLSRRAVGAPHPGLCWYVAAMLCLALGLGAALLIPLFPEAHAALRDFHLHINLYGFIGLTAVGTLQVLMPTAAGQPDPEAGGRLKHGVRLAFFGSLLLAAGQAAEAFWLAALGTGLWGWVLGEMLLAWLRLFRGRMLRWHGVEPALGVAGLGFAAALAATLLDSAGMLELSSPLTIFLPGFLMPLISGAAGQLAPVWLKPGRREEWHDQSVAALGRWGGARALLFLSAALIPLFGYQCAGMPGLAALFWFGILFVMWLARD